MNKFLTRFTMVFAALAAPSFLGGSLVFHPFVTLYIWGANAMKYHRPDIGPADTTTLVLTVLTMLAVPAALAFWFGVCDVLRFDIKGVCGRSKPVLHIMIAACSWLLMFIGLAVSNAYAGPLFVWGSGDVLFRTDPSETLVLTAFALLAIELVTAAWFLRKS